MEENRKERGKRVEVTFDGGSDGSTSMRIEILSRDTSWRTNAGESQAHCTRVIRIAGPSRVVIFTVETRQRSRRRSRLVRDSICRQPLSSTAAALSSSIFQRFSSSTQVDETLLSRIGEKENRCERSREMLLDRRRDEEPRFSLENFPRNS